MVFGGSLLFSGCTSYPLKNDTAEAPIPLDTLENLLVSIQIIEAAHAQYTGGVLDSSQQAITTVKPYYLAAFKRHNVTESQFLKSMTSLTQQPPLMDSVYAHVIEKLTQRSGNKAAPTKSR